MSAFYIPKPCHENWNSMTPQEKGRHCQVCSTVVVDFTKKTSVEIAEVISSTQGTVCGHFNVNQLDAKAQNKVFKNPLNIFNKNWKYFVLSVFGLFFINKKSNAQEIEGKIKMRGMVAPTHNANTQTSTITGIVTTPDGTRLQNANIIITSNEKVIAKTITDADGKYLIKIEPGNIQNKKISIRVHHNFYESKVVKDLGIYKFVTTLNIQMESEVMMMGIVEEVRIPEQIIQKDTIVPINNITLDSIKIEKICSLNQDTTQVPLVVNDTTTNTLEKEPEKPINNLVVIQDDIMPSIYPNPAGTYSTVYCNTVNDYTIEIYSLSGALQQTHAFNGDKIKLDVSKLQRGTYFVRVNDETGTLNTLKLVKQ